MSQRNPSQFPYLPQIQSDEPVASRSVDDFGVTNSSISGSIAMTGPGNGGRFATFPVKNNRPTTVYTLANPPAQPGNEDSFSSSVAEALRSSQSPPAAGTFGVPGYEGSQAPHGQTLYAPPPGPPPGMHATGDHYERYSVAEDDAALAYTDDPQELHSTHEMIPDPHHMDSYGRHVRFGEERNLEEESQQVDRDSNDATPAHQHQSSVEAPRYSQDPPEYQPEPHPPQPQNGLSVDSGSCLLHDTKRQN